MSNYILIYEKTIAYLFNFMSSNEMSQRTIILNRKNISVIISMWFFSCNLHAESLPRTTYVEVVGTIGTNTCEADWSGGGGVINIPMGDHIRERGKGNVIARPGPVYFRLKNCTLTYGVYAKWSGVPDKDDPTLFQIGGTAAGVAIGLEDEGGGSGTIKPEDEVVYSDVEGFGEIDMDFTPRLVQTQDVTSPGTLNTTITVYLRYQ